MGANVNYHCCAKCAPIQADRQTRDKNSQNNIPANQPPPEWVLDGLEAPVPPGCGRDADERVQGEHHVEHHRAPPPEWDLDGLEAPVPLGAVGMSMKMFGKVRKLKTKPALT